MTTRTVWKDEAIACGCQERLGARVYAPADQRAGSGAVVLHLHGGCFVGGDLAGGSRVASLLAAAGATVVSFDYPLAPSHPFPQAIEAVHEALSWADRHRRRLGGAGARLFVAGEEAGGNLAAAAALMARDRRGPVLAGQLLLSPMLDVCISTASWRDIKAGEHDCPWADGWRKYLPRASDAIHPYATPGSSMRLDGLPPTLLVTAHDDPLRDETGSFARRLREAGVPVDEVELALPTGWPASYAQPADSPAAWAEALRPRLRQFLVERSPAPA